MYSITRKEFLLVTNAINPRLTGFVDKNMYLMNNVRYDITRIEDRNSIHLCMTFPVISTVPRFYHFHVLLNTYDSACNKDVDIQYRKHPNHRGFSLNLPLANMAITKIFKDIAKKQEKLVLFRVGLIDSDSTLKSLSSNKIFDRHLARLIYSFVE